MDVSNSLYITGLVILTTPTASAIMVTFIVDVSVAFLAFCFAVGEGRPEVDGDAPHIVIVNLNILLQRHKHAALHLSFV